MISLWLSLWKAPPGPQKTLFPHTEYYSPWPVNCSCVKSVHCPLNMCICGTTDRFMTQGIHSVSKMLCSTYKRYMRSMLPRLAILQQPMTGTASCSSSVWVIDAGTQHHIWLLEHTVVNCYVPCVSVLRWRTTPGGRKMINNHSCSHWIFHRASEEKKIPVKDAVWQRNDKNLTPSLLSETAGQHDTQRGSLGFK